MKKTAILLGIMVTALASCKSSYTILVKDNKLTATKECEQYFNDN